MNIDSVVALVKSNFPEAVINYYDFRGELTFVIEKEQITTVAAFFKKNQELDCNYLSDLCGVDKIKTDGIFEVVYHLYSIQKKHRVRLKVPLPSDNPTISTVTTIWNTANWHERETYDMFGIQFQGHPDLRKILMPEDFEGHPLRKDYPIHGRQPATLRDIYRKDEE
ncbi:MAG: NADH-quinone oxidoreductase subunit C [Candidatus Kuenenia sp.]|nr:NADH-quinone oxidoreductase subunit C [Candidatus Kuenenia hertensis]